MQQFDLSGTHHEIGKKFGSQCVTEIRGSLRRLIEEIHAMTHLSREEMLNRAAKYGQFILDSAPNLMEELEGMAAGAAIDVREAILLQVRFEIAGWPKPLAAVNSDEGCTSFAVSALKAFDGHTILGQNHDTRNLYSDRGIILRIEPIGGVSVLMYTYLPGLIGYRGINSEGIGHVGNGVLSKGWQPGFPRYLLMRVALEEPTVERALSRIAGLTRGSTTNFRFGDAHGRICDLEVTVRDHDVLEPVDGCMAHANHYLSEKLKPDAVNLSANSEYRQTRMEELVRQVAANPPDSIAGYCDLLRDHDRFPGSICRHLGSPDGKPEWKTVTSFILRPGLGKMHVAMGNPCENEYRTFEL